MLRKDAPHCQIRICHREESNITCSVPVSDFLGQKIWRTASIPAPLLRKDAPHCQIRICHREESNLQLSLRTGLLYPFNYGGVPRLYHIGKRAQRRPEVFTSLSFFLYMIFQVIAQFKERDTLLTKIISCLQERKGGFVAIEFADVQEVDEKNAICKNMPLIMRGMFLGRRTIAFI